MLPLAKLQFSSFLGRGTLDNMLSVTTSIFGLLATVPLAAAGSSPNVLYKDVVVVGGGASGAYAAVRIRDDFGKSIALIEKQDILVSK